MKRRIIVFVLTFLMVFSYLPFVKADTNKISELQQKNIVAGRDGGDLALDKTLTRAEFIKLLVHASKLEYMLDQTDLNTHSFLDVTSKHWAFKYIELMKKLGVANGMPDGKFHPDNSISYEEVVAFISRLDKNFVDNQVSSDANWAAKYIDYAKSNGFTADVNISDFKNASIRKSVFEIIYNSLPVLESRNKLHDLKSSEIDKSQGKKDQGKEKETVKKSEPKKWNDSYDYGYNFPTTPDYSYEPQPEPQPQQEPQPEPQPQPQPKPEPKPDPEEHGDPTDKDSRKILGQFIDKAKSRIAGVTISEETNPANIYVGEVVANQVDVDKLKDEIKTAETVFNNPNATKEFINKAKARIEQAIIDFKTIEGEKVNENAEVYIAKDFVIEGNVIKGFTDDGLKKLNRNAKVLKIPTIDGVNEIGMNAFVDNGIKVLEIPGSIETISRTAFLKNGITKLTLNEGLKHVKANAFTGNNIKSITIPGTLNDIEANAFRKCNIVNLTFKDGVTIIGESAFTENSINNIVFPKTLKGIDLGAFKSNLVQNVDFPDGLEVIAPKIFCRNKIMEVTVPNSLKVFCGNSFRFNPGFEGDSIFKINLRDPITIDSLDGKTIEEKLTEVVKLRPYIFKGHIKDEKTALGIDSWELVESKDGFSTYSAKFEQISTEKLNSLLGPNKSDGTSNETVQENLKKIRLFVKVKVSAEDLGIWNEDEFTVDGNKITGFSDKGKEKVAENKRLIIPMIDGVDTIDKSAFRNPNRGDKFNLEYIEIPANIKTIEKAAFGANPIKEVKFNEGLESIGNSAFMAHQIESLVLPNSLKEIGDMAFMADRKNATLTNLELGENLESIGRNAFMRGKLTSLVLNDNLKKIAVNAFSGNEIKSIKFNKGLEVIECSAFGNNKLSKVNLPTSLVKICENVFSGNSGAEVFFGNTLGVKEMKVEDIKALLKERVKTKVGYGKNGASLAKIIDWTIEGDIAKPVFDEDASKIITEPPFVVKLDANFEKGKEKNDDFENQGESWTAADFVVENGVIKALADEAKNKLATSPHVIIPSKDKDGGKITKIANNLFGRNAHDPDDTKIKSLIIEDGIEEIGVGAFRNNLIEEVIIPDSVKLIGGGAFSNCESLKKVTLSKNLTKIMSSTFYGCPITEISLPEGIIEVGMRAFQNADIRTLVIPKSLIKIGSNAFTNNKNLQSLDIPGTVVELGTSAFGYCGLINVKLNEGLQKIGKEAFRYNNIGSVIIPSTVTKMGTDVFKDNLSIKVRYQKLIDAIANLESHQDEEMSAELKAKYDGVLQRAKSLDGKDSATLKEVNTMCGDIDQFIKEIKESKINQAA